MNHGIEQNYHTGGYFGEIVTPLYKMNVHVSTTANN